MTILGQHTVSELRDLVTDKDSQMAQVQSAYDANASRVDSSWLSDWNALKSRYASARNAASVVMTLAKTSPIPDSTLPAEDTYQAILTALTKTPGSYTDQDWQGLYNRLTAAIGSAPPVVAVQPVSTDVDLNTFNAANSVAASAPDWVHRAVATLAPGLVPQDKTSASYKPVSKWLLIGGAALAGVVALKVVLR